MKIGKFEVEFYDNYTEMPITKWQQFNLEIMYSLNIGSNINDFITHTNKISNFVKVGETEKALKSIRNMEISVNNIFENFNSTVKPFKYMIKTIDGNKEFTDETYYKLISKYDLSYNMVNQEVLALKKKSKTRLKIFIQQIKQTLITIITLRKLRLLKEQKQSKTKRNTTA